MYQTKYVSFFNIIKVILQKLYESDAQLKSFFKSDMGGFDLNGYLNNRATFNDQGQYQYQFLS